MKQTNFDTPEPRDKFVSNTSESFVGNFDSNDVSTLKESLIFLQGILKAKEEELARLNRDKATTIDSKLELMVENALAKKERVDMDRKCIQAEKEKEEALIQSRTELKVMEDAFKKELAEMAKMLSQTQQEKEDAIKSKIELMMDVKVAKQETAEVGRKLIEVKKEKDAALTSKIDLFIQSKVLQKEVTEKLEMVEILAKIEKEKEEAIAEIGSLKMRITELEEVKDHLTKQMESYYVWKITGTKVAFGNDNSDAVSDSLSCNPLKSGAFEWEIRVEKACNYVRLGVIISSQATPLNEWLGTSKKTWGSCCNGFAYNDDKTVGEYCPTFKTGSVVYFILDLTGNGILRISVDGLPLVKIFSNMKSSLDKDEGFLPAVGLCWDAKIELLYFQSYRKNLTDSLGTIDHGCIVI